MCIPDESGTVTAFITKLGILVKDEKTVGPAQRMEYIGITLDSVEGRASISPERQLKLRDKVALFIKTHEHSPMVHRTSLAQILGSLNWFSPFYSEASKLMPPLWQSLYRLQPHLRLDQAWSNNAHVEFTPEAKKALVSWEHVLKAPPSRNISLFGSHKGLWAGRAYTTAFALPI